MAANGQDAANVLQRRLYAASKAGDLAAVHRALAAGAKPNVPWRAPDQVSLPLVAAAAFDHAAVIDVLIAAGADVNACEPANGSAALHTAAAVGSATALNALLAAGADVRLLNSDSCSALHLAAARDGDGAIIRRLLAAGVPLEGREASGFTPLHIAVVALRPPAVVELLLDAGADITATFDIQGSNVLYCCFGSEEAYARPGDAVAVARLLLALPGAGPLVNARAADGFTPLMAAANDANTEGISLLLQHGADARVTDGAGQGPLHVLAAGPPDMAGAPYPSMQRVRAALAALLAAGADPGACDGQGRNALQIAVAASNAPAAVAMLDSGRWAAADLGRVAYPAAAVGGLLASVQPGIIVGYEQQAAALQAELADKRLTREALQHLVIQSAGCMRDAKQLRAAAAEELAVAAAADPESAAASVMASKLRAEAAEARVAEIEARAAAAEARVAEFEAAAAAAAAHQKAAAGGGEARERKRRRSGGGGHDDTGEDAQDQAAQ